ncbi:MAG: phenylalanine--tRNA ligase subunit alpha, partial [Lachnospiraceae bacterium]|nr:phenylalanine--tRNA ligase subunit alpha [Lachnospiraceae bacterium]
MGGNMADFTELAEKLSGIRRQILEGLASVRDSKGVYEYRKGVMDGKTGLVGSLMREMGKIPAENRAEYGKQVNDLKNWVTDRFNELDARLKAAELEAKYASEQIDVTEPAKKRTAGNLHPITQVTNELIDIFTGMGFSVYEGTEIENDYYNYTALNTPADHPARDMQDTFYLSPEFLL